MRIRHSIIVAQLAALVVAACSGSDSTPSAASATNPGDDGGVPASSAADGGVLGVPAPVSNDGGSSVIAASFFGIDENSLNSPWPPSTAKGPAPAKALRLWDSAVHWSQIETCDASTSPGFAASDPANPCYDWTHLDTWVSRAQAQGMDVVYTLGAVPDWATSQPLPAPKCAHYNTYSCLAPTDVGTDGTGTDAIYIAFVTALATKYKGAIRYYESWNEPDTTMFYAGTSQQFARMMKDAYTTIKSIDGAAQVLGPSFHGPTAATWFAAYLAGGGAAWFDIVNFHGRGQGAANEQPESFLAVYGQAETVLKANALTTRPFWDDEGGYLQNQVDDPDMKEAYVARAYALRAGVGIGRFYWYQWDSPVPYGLQGSPGGEGYASMAAWIVGASVSACTPTGTIWTCGVTRDGVDSAIAWDTSQTCSAGNCPTTTATVDPKFGRFTDLAGTTTTITGHAVPLGAKPALIAP